MTAKQRDIILGKIPAEAPEIAEIARQFPYLIVPVAATLRDNPGAEAQIPSALKARMAICVGDDDSLARIIGEEPEMMADFYGENTTITPDTDSAIDTFLNTYGQGNSERENDALTKMIFNPTPDYALLEDDEAKYPLSEDATSLGIESFLASRQASSLPSGKKKSQDAQKSVEREIIEGSDASETSENEPPIVQREVSSLSESLAQVMIKKGNYTKALEIITELSLKNPEKITYFADQIRFLKKLIIITDKTKSIK